MFRNYLLVALRMLNRQRGYALLNIVGLSVGVAACLLLLLVVQHHVAYDRHQHNYDRIYRLVADVDGPEGKYYEHAMAYPLAPTLRVQAADSLVTAVYNLQETILTVDRAGSTDKFVERRGAYVEPTWFQLFRVDWLQGNPAKGVQPGQILLAKRLADKFFPNGDALGKRIRVDNTFDVLVAGVFADPPVTSNFGYEFYLSYQDFKRYGDQYTDSWGTLNSNHEVYVLADEPKRNRLEAFFPQFLVKNIPDERDRRGVTLKLQPLADLHLNENYNVNVGPTTTRTQMGLLLVIGGLLVFTACINYVNLSTARALRRSQEIGIRKVLGGNRKAILVQGLAETAVITVASVVLAFALAELALPAIADFMNLEIAPAHRQLAWVLPALLGLWLLTTLAAGLYPAVLTSRVSPIQAMRAQPLRSGNTRGFSLRKMLIVTQFVATQVLLIGMLVVHSQMRYMMDKELGFQFEAVAGAGFQSGISAEVQQQIKGELLASPAVVQASIQGSPPSSGWWWTSSFRWETRTQPEDWGLEIKIVDENYLDLYSIPLVVGRNLTPADTNRALIVNEAFVKRIGLARPEEALGKIVATGGGQHKREIVGVARDFHLHSLHTKIGPAGLMQVPLSARLIGVKLAAGQTQAGLKHLQQVFERRFPTQVYAYEFLDEQLAGEYRREQAMFTMFTVFAGLAIFIACLGLLGLAAFMTSQRVKEIGIRKVLGASVRSILALLSRDFALLIAIAFVLAVPIAAYAMDAWLADYPYRIPLSPLLFVGAGLATLGVALLVVSLQSMRAATANPVESLRSE